jgi:hypothetical protein
MMRRRSRSNSAAVCPRVCTGFRYIALCEPFAVFSGDADSVYMVAGASLPRAGSGAMDLKYRKNALRYLC